MKKGQKRSLSSIEEEDGLWIQCCNENCKKWRFVKEFHDPLSVPESWVCSQNRDNHFSSCNIPEQLIDESLILTSEYNTGSIVWAKIKGFPWWPAIIDDSPETQTYYKLEDSLVPVKYHVTFFNEEKVERAWLKPEKIKPFKEDGGKQPVRKAKIVYSGVNYMKSLQKSLELARYAMTLDVNERLKKFSIMKKCNEFIANPQVIAGKTHPNKKSKRNTGSIKYITANVEREQIGKEIKSLICNREMQEIALPNSDENKQVFEMNQISITKQNRWNFCSIQ